jgi:membrane protein implicated in regulation of membrane protease activity
LRSLAVALGFYLLGFVLPNLIGAVLVLLTNWPFAVTTFVSLILKAILFPVSAVGLAMLFYDLRRRSATADHVKSEVDG